MVTVPVPPPVAFHSGFLARSVPSAQKGASPRGTMGSRPWWPVLPRNPWVPGMGEAQRVSPAPQKVPQRDDVCEHTRLRRAASVRWGHFCGRREGGPEEPQPCSASCPQLQELHRAGGDLMHRDEQSRTLLHHAVSTGSKEVVRYLLDHGELATRVPAARGQAGGHQASLTSPSPLLQPPQRSLMLWRRSEYLGRARPWLPWKLPCPHLAPPTWPVRACKPFQATSALPLPPTAPSFLFCLTALWGQTRGPQDRMGVHGQPLFPQWGDVSAPGGSPGPAHHLPLHRGGWGLSHEDRPAGEQTSRESTQHKAALSRRRTGSFQAVLQSLLSRP